MDEANVGTGIIIGKDIKTGDIKDSLAYSNKEKLQDIGDIKARVFVSCGQSKDEIEVARNISRKLSDMGFDPFVALEEQTLKGIKENVFPKLEESEYFIFVDFKREKLENDDYRGSLFSHQELAVATFLDKDVLAFQEKGLKSQDGIMGSIQANSIDFSDRHLLAGFIADKIRDLEWNTNWRNELKLGLNDKSYDDGFYPPLQESRRWYHINVRNLHRKRITQDCTAYLESEQKSLDRRNKNLFAN